MAEVAKYPYKETSINYDFRSQYAGFGIPFYIKENEFNLYINSVIGVTTQRFFVQGYKPNQTLIHDPLLTDDYNANYIKSLTFANTKNNWNSFFLFQYRLNEVVYGITFSGEIRGLILKDAKPVITLAFSKKINLSGLFKPLLSGDK